MVIASFLDLIPLFVLQDIFSHDSFWRSYKTSIQQAELETNFWPILHTCFQSFWSCFISIFLSLQNHEPLESGFQFFPTAISQVLSTLSGPKLIYTLNLLQVVRNKGRQIGILTNTCKLLWRKNWPPPPMLPLWLPWFCLTRSNTKILDPVWKILRGYFHGHARNVKSYHEFPSHQIDIEAESPPTCWGWMPVGAG